MLWMIILIVGYALFFSLLLFYKKIIEIFQNANNQFFSIKYASIVGIGVAAWFIVWSLVDLFNPANNIFIGGIGLYSLLLPPIATFVGTIGFLISWAIITIYAFFSSKHRSNIPKTKLILQTLVAVLILITTIIFTYAFVTRQLLLRDAKSPQISQTRLSDIYAKVIKKGDTKILGELAINPNTSIQVLEEIYASFQQYPANAKYYPIFISLAKNRNTPGKILEKLAKKPDGEIKHYIADNPNTTIETLRTLADDKYYFVRIAVAKNPNVTRDILIKLKSDKNEEVSKSANSAWRNRGFDKTPE